MATANLNNLKAYSIGPDTFIAADEQDAVAACREHVGDWYDPIIEGDPIDEIPDDQELTIWFEADYTGHIPQLATCTRKGPYPDSVSFTAPARAWANHAGRGFLCSTEY